MNYQRAIFLAVIMTSACGAASSQGAGTVQMQLAPGTLLRAPVALQMGPGVTLAQVRALPANAMVQTRSGRQVNAGQLQATAQALQGLSAKRSRLRRFDLTLTRPAGAPQVNLTSAAQLPQIRSMAPGTVVQLRDGSKVTVADIGRLEDFAARTNFRARLASSGRSGSAGSSAQPAGNAVKIASAADAAKLKGMPDSTVVEGPNGVRSTLGDLKAALTKTYGQK